MNIKIMIAAAIAICGVFTQCTTNLDIRRIADESEFVAPRLTGPDAINITSDAVASDEVISFTWTRADFGQPTEVVYSINAGYGENASVLFGNITASEYSVSAGELSQKLMDLGLSAGVRVEVYVSISATVGSDFGSIESDPVPVSVLIEE